MDNNRIYTEIGEHFLQIDCHSDTLMDWIQRNLPTYNASIRVKTDLFIQIEGSYGVPYVDDHVTIHKEPAKICFCRADYLIEADLDFRSATIFVHNELALKHALLNLYSSFVVHDQWGLVIHSSCVVEKGKAHMFAGHSGAGKSTAAALSHPRELLSDEATLVKITTDEITVYNSPFRSELGMTRSHAAESYPLTSIQLLNQASFNRRTGLNKSNGLLLLMDKVFYWTHDTAETIKIFGLLSMLADIVPIYDLYFQKNDTFWEWIS